jgi:prolyl-tRNA editing enzyme YbaK/EbsC (Cys-tRNA(Pro) deacylase)
VAIEAARKHLSRWGREKDILEFQVSTATVELAAAAAGVEPARIAKTLTYRIGEGAVMVVAAGDARTDNGKFKSTFGTKSRMLSAEEALQFTGHAVGGICPFGLANDMPVWLDVSLRRFETVYPACGSSNSAIELTCAELETYSGSSGWVDICKDWNE